MNAGTSPITSNVDNASTSAKLERFRAINPDRWVAFNLEIDNWEPNNFHWNAPSHMTIWNDGDYLIYADHLAHQNPGAGARRFIVNCSFYSKKDGKGTLLHANKYALARLTHKQQIWSATRNGTDVLLGDRMSEIQSVTYYQSIEP